MQKIQNIKKSEILEEINLIHLEILDDLKDRISRFLKYKQFNEKKDKNIIMKCLPNSLKKRVFLTFSQFQN